MAKFVEMKDGFGNPLLRFVGDESTLQGSVSIVNHFITRHDDMYSIEFPAAACMAEYLQESGCIIELDHTGTRMRAHKGDLFQRFFTAIGGAGIGYRKKIGDTWYMLVKVDVDYSGGQYTELDERRLKFNVPAGALRFGELPIESAAHHFLNEVGVPLGRLEEIVSPGAGYDQKHARKNDATDIWRAFFPKPGSIAVPDSVRVVDDATSLLELGPEVKPGETVPAGYTTVKVDGVDRLRAKAVTIWLSMDWLDSKLLGKTDVAEMPGFLMTIVATYNCMRRLMAVDGSIDMYADAEVNTRAHRITDSSGRLNPADFVLYW
jgi:hypothetical protein